MMLLVVSPQAIGVAELCDRFGLCLGFSFGHYTWSGWSWGGVYPLYFRGGCSVGVWR